MKSPKTFNLFIVTVAILVGLAALSAGSWLLYQERVKLAAIWPKETIDKDQLRQRCLVKLKALDIQAFVLPDDRIRAQVAAKNIASMTNPEIWFDRFSIGILGCSGYRLDYFCAGSGCQPSSFYMILVPWSSIVTPEVAPE